MHKLNIAEWNLDLNQNCLHSKSANVHIEQKPLLLLLFLVANSGEVIHKERILNTIWCGRVVSEEVISVAISQLRKALKDKARSPRFIKTIPGAGYQFIFDVKQETKLQVQGYLRKLFHGQLNEIDFSEPLEEKLFLTQQPSTLMRNNKNILTTFLALQIFTIVLTVIITIEFTNKL